MTAALRASRPDSTRLFLFPLLSSLVLMAACGDADNGPTAVWGKDGVREQGSLTLSPSSFHVREGDSLAINATYEGPASFDAGQVQWSVEPAGAGSVRNGWFVPSNPGEATVTARFSALSASASGTITVPPTRMEVASFEGDLAFAGRPVPGDVSVRVTGRDGLPVVGEDVRFEVVNGGGEVAQDVRQTDSQGIARVSWTMGPKVGNNTLRAVVEDLQPLEVSTESTADRSTATVEIREGDEQLGRVNDVLPVPLAVQVVDRFGNPVDGVMLEWIFDGGQGASTPDGFTHTYSSVTWKQTPTDSLGRSQLYWKLGRRAGSQIATVDLAGAASSTADSEDPAAGPPKHSNGYFKAQAESGGAVSMEVRPDYALMTVGQTLDFVAYLIDEFGNETTTNASWSLSDASAAKVTGNGRVTAQSSGSFSVIATSGSLTAEARVDAGNFRVAAQPSRLTLAALQEESTLSAVVYDASDNPVEGQSLDWSSTNTSVISVDSLGRIRSHANGIAYIVVSLSCCTIADSVEVQVDQQATQIVVEPAQLELEIGDSRTVVGTALDANGYAVEDATITWSSSDPDIATVSPDGIVTAHAAGTISVLASVGALFGTVSTAIAEDVQEPVSIEASVESRTFTALEESFTASATTRDESGSTTSSVLSWRSTNTGVATVDGSGRIVAKGNGTAQVIVTPQCCLNVADTIDITVDQAPAAVLVDPSSFSLSPGGAKQLAAIVRDKNGFDVPGASVSWRSTNTSVIQMGSDGMAKAVDSGSATVEAVSGSATGTSSASVSGGDSDPDDGGTDPTGLAEPIFSDDFESGGLETTAGGFGWNNKSFPVSTDIARSGTSALRFTFGPDASGEDSSAELRFSLGSAVTEIWMELWIYYPDGTEGVGARYVHRDDVSSDNNKFLRLWGGDYNSSNKVGVSTRPIADSGDSRLSVEYMPDEKSIGNWGAGGVEPFVTDGSRGRWVNVRWHSRLADGPSTNNGVVEMWIDGTLSHSNTSMDIYNSSGINYWDRGYLLGWANSGFKELTNIYIDDVRVWFDNPGW